MKLIKSVIQKHHKFVIRPVSKKDSQQIRVLVKITAGTLQPFFRIPFCCSLFCKCCNLLKYFTFISAAQVAKVPRTRETLSFLSETKCPARLALLGWLRRALFMFYPLIGTAICVM